MAFRTLEISKPSEIHIKTGEMIIQQEECTVEIPLEDLMTIVCIGSGIRLSTQALGKICDNGISLMVMDEKYRPVGIMNSVEGNSRQMEVMTHQISLPETLKNRLWIEIVRQKLANQGRVLRLLNRKGEEQLIDLSEKVLNQRADYCEAAGAKTYFEILQPGITRREEDPINSQLNYGYAVVRNALIRNLLSAGFQPGLGIHHCNQLNAFNLADDLIEPWRPIVDLTAYSNPAQNQKLSKEERYIMAHVLHNACLMDKRKVSILSGIECMVESLKRIMVDKSDEDLKLPTVIPIESFERIKE